ncbi:hypothetical protein [Vibrio sp. MA40-2]|uniref:hypothetical protein n=1 Tax=Vibrio sp. MA40-2 TaxID=3391828 RepID=UPI0039A5A299
MSEKIVSVITGDIVDSQKIAPEDYEKMLTILKTVLTKLVEQVDARFDMYRGDAFQIVFFEPADAVLSALKIRLALKTSELRIDARQCIGIGRAMHIGNDIKTSTGEAFVLSGTGLDKLKSNHLTIQSNNSAFQDKTYLLTKFLDAHISGLTTIQTEALWSYFDLTTKTHEDIATALGKKRTNITKLLNASHYQLIEEYIRHFEKCVKEEYQ